MKPEFRKSKLFEDDDTAITSTDDAFEVTEIEDAVDDEKIFALAEYLNLHPLLISKSDYNDTLYIVSDDAEDHDGETYYVCTDEEADDLQRERVQSLLEDIGPKDCGLDVFDYINETYIEELMEETIRDDIANMSDEDFIDELLGKDISLDNEEFFTLKDDVDTEDEDFDPEDTDNYIVIRNWSTEDKLYDLKTDGEDLYRMYIDYGYGDWIEDDVEECARHGGFPSYVDEDKMVDDLIERGDRGADISSYDGEENYINYNGTDYYIYRDN